MKIYKSLIYILVFLSVLIQSQNSYAQVTFTADFNWTTWSGENCFTIYDPNLKNPLGCICAPSNCYDGTNGTYTATNVSLGTMSWMCGSYYIYLYDKYGDGWNSGGSVTIYANGVSVGTFSLASGSSTSYTFALPTTGLPFGALGGPTSTGGIPSGCNASTLNIASGQYSTLNLEANTYYDFTMALSSQSTAWKSDITSGGSGATSTTFNTNQTGWFSGTTIPTLKVYANRGVCTWTATSSVLTYKNSTPSVPGTPTLTTNGCTSATVGWTASTSASGYEMQVSTSSSFSTNISGNNCGGFSCNGSTNIGKVTSATITGLSVGTTYYIRVRAINGSTPCRSSFSTTFSFTTCSAPTITSSYVAPTFCVSNSFNPTTPTVVDNGSTITSQGWQLETSAGSGTYSSITVPYTLSYSDNGKSFQYVATNSCGTTTNRIGTLTVNNVPTISAPVTPNAFCAGNTFSNTTPTVTDNGSTITSQGWEIETGVGTNTYTTLSLPYTLTYADNVKKIRYTATNGCGTTKSTSVTLTVNNVPTVSNISTPAALCTMSSLNLTAPSVNNNGSVSVTGWEIENGVGTNTFNTLTLPYSVVYSDNGKKIRYSANNNCGVSYSNTVILTVNNTPSISIISQPPSFCDGDVFNPSTPTVINNGSPITYQGWKIENNAGSGIYSSITIPYTITLADDGKFIIYSAVNSCGNTSSNVIKVSVNAKPTANPSFTSNLVCSGNTTILSANATAGSGTIYSYSWSSTLGNVSNGNVSSPGTYSVTVTNSNGCTVSATSPVLNSAPTPTITVTNTTICLGDTGTISASGGVSYQWVTGETTQSISQLPTTTTSYSVSVTDNNGCTGVTDVLIEVNDTPTVFINSTNQMICMGDIVELTAVGANTYIWSTGDLIDDIYTTPISTTTYSVTGFDVNNCKSTSSETIIVDTCDDVLNNLLTTILPINLLSFTATCKLRYVSIEWVTIIEINNEMFIIEKSEDAINYIEIGTVAGSNNSTVEKRYFFNDTEIENNKVLYYRLKQIDYDGTFSYSPIVSIKSCMIQTPKVILRYDILGKVATDDTKGTILELYDDGKVVKVQK